MKKKISAVVLAAGLSKRMGSINKMLLDINGKPMLGQVIDQLLDTQVNEIIVVTGHENEKVSQIIPEVPNRIRVINNVDYRQGMSTSISQGARHLVDPDGCMICLGDMPFITHSEYDKIIAGFTKSDQIVVPRFQEVAGNPILFGSQYVSDLCALDSADQGAKKLIQRNNEKQIFIEMETDHIHRDIDQVSESQK